MIVILLCSACALACYRMGYIIGKMAAQEEFDEIRNKISLETKGDLWDELFKE